MEESDDISSKKSLPPIWEDTEASDTESYEMNSRRCPSPCGKLRAEKSEAWAVLIAVVLSNTSAGLFGLSGVLIPQFVTLYNCTLEEASWAYSVQFSSFSATGFIILPVVTHFGTLAPLAVAAACIASVVTAIPYYGTVWICVFFYGGVGGVGIGSGMYMGYYLVRKYFTDFYGLAIAIYLLTNALYGSFSPYILFLLQGSLGDTQAFYVFGAMAAVSFLSVGIMAVVERREATKPIAVLNERLTADLDRKSLMDLCERDRSASDAACKNSNSPVKSHRKTLQVYLFFVCHKEFWLFSSAFLSGLVASMTAHGLVYDLMLQRGISEELATMFVLVMGVCLACGRGCVGLGIMKHIPCLTMLLSALLFLGCLSFSLPHVQAESLVGVCMMGMGFCVGAIYTLGMTCAYEVVQDDCDAFANFCYAVCGILSVAGAPLAASLEPDYGYEAVMYLGGSFAFLGASVIGGWMLFLAFEKRRQSHLLGGLVMNDSVETEKLAQ